MPATAGAIRAGRAFVQLFCDDSLLRRGLASAQQRLRAFGGLVTKMGAGLMAGGAAIATPLLGAAKVFADMGSEVADMSARTGMSAEAISQLGYAAGQSGADMATLETGIKKMQRNLDAAAHGSSTAIENFDRLGLSVGDLAGLSPDQQFAKIAQALSLIKDPGEKAALAMDLFGKSGTMLLPLMNSGAAGIAALRAEADALGLTMSSEDAAAAEEFGDAMDKLWKTLKAVTFQIGAALAPVLLQGFNLVSDFATTVIAWAKDNRGLVQTIAIVTAGVIGLGGALVVIGGAVTLLSFGLGGLGTLLGLIFSPLGLIVAGLTALTVWLFRSGEATKWLGTTFGPLAEEATASFGAIKNALAAGDFGAAANVLWSTLRMWWSKGINWLLEKWITLKIGLMDIWLSVQNGLSKAWIETVNFLGSIWDSFTTGLKQSWTTLVGKITEWSFRITGDDSLAEAANQNMLDEVGRLEQEREQRQEQRERQRTGALDEIDAQTTRDAAAAQQQFNQELMASEQAMHDASDAWQAAVDAANSATPAEGVDVPDFDPSSIDDLMSQLGDGQAAMSQAASNTQQGTAGTFSTMVGQIFASGRGPQERTANATEETAQNTRLLLRDGRGNLRFTV